MSLDDYRERYRKLAIKKDLHGDRAMEAVQQNGHALRYVKAQTEAICLAAVKQNGDALQYVNSDLFGVEPDATHAADFSFHRMHAPVLTAYWAIDAMAPAGTVTYVDLCVLARTVRYDLTTGDVSHALNSLEFVLNQLDRTQSEAEA